MLRQSLVDLYGGCEICFGVGSCDERTLENLVDVLGFST